MILKVYRLPAVNNAVIGSLLMDGVFICYTLENDRLKIPVGVYPLSLYDSPHAGHIVPLLAGVPGRAEIEIHCGNMPRDSKGCLLVGLNHTDDTVEDSISAFDLLLPKISDAIYAKELVTIAIY